MKNLYFLLVVLLPVFAKAQSKANAPISFWPELQLSTEIGEGSLLFFKNGYRINTDNRYNDLRDSGILSNFERIELSVGFEQTLSDHWRAGAIYRYAIEDFPKSQFYTLFLRHNGHLKSLYFNKQLTAEYVRQENHDPFGRFAGMAELGKRLPLKSKFITPAIAIDAMVISDFSKEDKFAAQERTIDRTRLRFSLNYELTDKLRINPYFMRQTDYYYMLVSPVYDEQGKLVKDGYTTKRNRISPVFGLEVKYAFNVTPNTASITY